MKKIYSLLFGLLVTLMGAGLFYSCEWWTEDDEITYNLEGTWGGEMYFASYYDNNWYYSNYTKLEFIEDGYNRGYGYWVDYYSQAPWDYVANHFDWAVRNGIIYIHLIEDNYDIQIRDYDITRRDFSGYVYYEGEERHFDLYHTSSPNWGNYDYGWGYDYDYGYNGWYSNRRGADSVTTDSVAAGKVAADKAADAAGKASAERPKRVLLPADGKMPVMK